MKTLLMFVLFLGTLVCRVSHADTSLARAKDAVPVHASPLVGVWKKVYSCEGATGVFEERCKEGSQDVFVLRLQVNGEHLCGTHMATAQLGLRVDEVEDQQPSISGDVKGNGATVQFHSTWGGSGKATVRIEGNLLHWKVVDKNDGQSWVPDDATLSRVPMRATETLPQCSSR